MKKRNITLLATVLGCLFGLQAFAQTNVNYPTAGVQTFNVVAPTPPPTYNFYDNGGQFGNYIATINQAGPVVGNGIIFAPSSTAFKVRATFTAFAVDPNWSSLYVKDGNTTSSPLINSGFVAPAISGPNVGMPANGFHGFGTGFAPRNGPNPVGVVTATPANASGALTFQFSSWIISSTGWESQVDQVSLCTPLAPANITVSTSTNDCIGSASINTPASTPAGCNTVNNLRYRVNAGAPVIVAQPLPATINISNLPKGVNVITYDYVDANGVPASFAVTQTITVQDLVKPVITCPSNVTLNLAPGECSTFFSYDVSVTDNCPFIQPAAPLQFPASFVPHGGGQVYSLSGNNQPCGLFFNLTNNSADPAIVTGFGIRFGNPAFGVVNGPQTVQLFSAPTYVGNENNAGAWTNLGPAVVNPLPPYFATGTGALGQANFTQNVTIPPGQTRGFFIFGVSASPIFNWNFGAALAPITNGIFTQTAGSIYFNQFNGPFQTGPIGHPNIQVNYQTGGAAEVDQTAGLPSGSEFPIGTTQNCFVTQDAAGNTSTCCFNVTVQEFPNAITSLVCNDFVNISLDSTCQHIVQADQVLEGGPYGCYDDYTVQIDKVLPYGNPAGPWVPAVLGPSDVGKTYGVRVVDPATGNSCWGLLKVEDKLPPVLVCRDLNIPCDSIPPVAPAPVGPGPAQTLEQDVPFTNYWTGYMNDLVNITTDDLQVTSVNVQASLAGAGAGVYNLRAYMKQGVHTGFAGNAGAWTLVGSVDVNITAGFPTVLTYDIPFTSPFLISAGQTAGIYIVANNGVGTGVRVVAQIGTAPTEDANLRIRNNPGNWVNGLFGGVAFAGENPRPQLAVTYSLFFPGIDVTDGCGPVDLTFTDTEIQRDCASGFTKTIRRKFLAVDGSGNSVTCIQNINFLRPNLGNVVVPPNYDDIDEPAFACTGVYPTPDYLESIGLQGYPTIDGFKADCGLSVEFEDKVIDVCDGTYKIRREWLLIDWCTGDEIEHVQLLKVVDDVRPNLTCPANLTVTTDPFTCCASVNLPDVIVSDVCSRINSVSAMIVGIDPITFDTIGMFTVGGFLSSFPGNNLWTPDTLANFGTTPCLPLGTHTVIYTVTDDCDNQATCTFRVTVRDFTPPVAACDEFTVVGIGVDDPYDCYLPSADGCEFAGVTWVKATTFDDGSYDNCGNVIFKVQRMAPYSDCIQNLNPINGQPECDITLDPFPDIPNEFERAISESDSIKFYCCEVGTTQMIILRVYQVDLNGNITVGPDGSPVVNECMVEVSVQDKLKPVCQAPANVTVSCENFDPSLWAYGNATVFDNCCLDTASVYLGQKGLTHTTTLSAFDTLCNKGTIIRRWTARDCNGQSSQCSQRIIVNYEQDYYVRFPNDVIVTFCDSSGVYGEPTFFGEDCELLGVSFQDEVYTVVPDACFKIERTWKVINWCTYDPNSPCINVPNPSPNATENSPANLPGPIVSPLGTPNPWAPTVVRIKSTDPVATNYSTFWNANANCYVYKQIIKIIDTQDPIIDNCPASPVVVNDLTPNDPQFYNANYFWDPIVETHDLCEAPGELTITASDACSGTDVNFSYLLFIDIDQNGTMETVISSNNLPGFNNINVGNAGNPNFTGGTPSAFDFRPVPSNQKYGFALQTTVSGGKKTARVAWNTLQSQNSYVTPQFPHGRHKIKWFVNDNCGNESVCEYIIEVRDGKAPTVVCINGLSVNIMPTGMIQLWDTDFLQYKEDNCTAPASKIVTGIRRAGAGTGFPRDAQGNPITNVNFTCADIGTQEVELWGEDLAGNADFCLTYVIVQDPNGVCGANATVAGALQTEENKGVEDSEVKLEGQNPAGPAFSYFKQSINDGSYEFSKAVPMFSNYVVTPTNDKNPLNGVSTYDLVLISKHILGLDPLNTPYKMIAADVNKSGSITTFDIVEARKLILGIYTDLPSNTSWRFVDKSFKFPNMDNPFQTSFPEVITVAQMLASDLDENFVGVKVGDVNGSAIANTLNSADDRSVGTLLFDAEDRAVKAGEVFTVNFNASEKVQGYQFTMNLKGLEVVEVVPGANMTSSNFGVFSDAVTASVDGDAGAFGVTFRAKNDGRLSQMLGASSRITRAEAYNNGAERLDVAFRFDGNTIAGVGFELYQNQPNPFIGKTMIGFHLPEAAEATLSIFDESGRVIYQQTADYGKGYNAVMIDRSLLNTVGMLYYRLETAKDSATKSMIQTK